ncbi:MAG: hypothetical protein ACPGRZ_09690 [Alphaproteobacteria bacterium]
MVPPATETGNQISPDSVDNPIDETRFSFAVEDLHYDAWIEYSATGSRVCVSCPLGNLPYSAENRTARKAVLMLLSASGNLPAARLMLTNYQKISLLVSELIDDPVDPKDVLAGAAAAVLKSGPLRRLMNECMAADPQ